MTQDLRSATPTGPLSRPTGRSPALAAVLVIVTVMLAALLAGCGAGVPEEETRLPTGFPELVPVPEGELVDVVTSGADGGWSFSVLLDSRHAQEAALARLREAGFVETSRTELGQTDVRTLRSAEHRLLLTLTTRLGAPMVRFELTPREGTPN